MKEPTAYSSRRRRYVLTLAMLPFAVTAAQAQVRQPNPFNFNPPGARSTAMGGAFVGLADDATAAATNPAGLTILLYPEVSFEFKTLEYTWDYYDAKVTDQVNAPSFASVVFPLGNLRFAAFRNEIVHLKAHGTFEWEDEAGPVRVDWLNTVKVQNYGAAFAIAASPKFSLGAAGGVSRYADHGDVLSNGHRLPDVQGSSGDTSCLAKRLHSGRFGSPRRVCGG